MRYYVDNFTINNLNNIQDFFKKHSKNNFILSTDGLYKYENNFLYKFKLKSRKNDIIIPNDKYNINATDISWDKYDISYTIPFIFNKIDIDIYDFSMNNDVIFKVEKYNNKIIDYYFVSKYSHDNFFLKDGIISFLSLFNNINNI